MKRAAKTARAKPLTAAGGKLGSQSSPADVRPERRVLGEAIKHSDRRSLAMPGAKTTTSPEDHP